MNEIIMPKHIAVAKPHDTLTKQHNALTEARYNISPLQKNILYLLFNQIKEAPFPKEPIKYKLSFREINLSRNMRLSKEDIHEAAKSMIASGFTIYDDDEKGFISTGLLENAEFGEGEDKDKLIVQFDPKTWKFLYSVTEKFTLFSLQNALNLKSKYSKRIYEMLSQFKGVYKSCLVYNKTLPPNSKKKKECIINISVQELKERFGLIDLQTGKETYPDFGDLERRILKPADEEINGNTEISYEWAPVKPEIGKKITKLQFKIINVEGIEKLSDLPGSTLEPVKDLLESTQEDSEVLKLKEKLNKLDVNGDIISEALKKIPHEEIHQMVYKVKNDQWVRNKGAYLGTLLQEKSKKISTLSNTSKAARPVQLKERTNGHVIDTIISGAKERQLTPEEDEDIRDKVPIWTKFFHGWDFTKEQANFIISSSSIEEINQGIGVIDELLANEEISNNSDIIFETLKKHLNLM